MNKNRIKEGLTSFIAFIQHKKLYQFSYLHQCLHDLVALQMEHPKRYNPQLDMLLHTLEHHDDLHTLHICYRIHNKSLHPLDYHPRLQLLLPDTHNTGIVEEKKIEECVRELFDLSPRGIIKSLNLLRPIYRKTAAYGHFGREDEDFTWERRDRVEDIKKYLKI